MKTAKKINELPIAADQMRVDLSDAKEMLMIKAPVPLNEAQRLEKLKDYQILDTSPESGMDEIAELAALITGTRMAAVSFVDENRQFFKARHGFNLSETPRDNSFCSHAIHEDIFVVEDATKDERFFDAPPVTEMGLQFYASVTLKTKEGLSLGTLCVFDPSPQKLTTAQIRQLEILSNQVLSQLELRRINLKMHKSEVRMLESQKRAAVGEMAVGIAHEINNPLAILCGRVELLKSRIGKRIPDGQDLIEDCDQLTKTAFRIASIIKSVKCLSSNGENLPLVRMSIGQSVEQVLTHTKEYLSKNGIKLETEISCLESFLGSEIQISQVLSNLVSNSVDAVRELSDKWIRISAHKACDALEIRVTDSGPGVAAQVQEKMFLPFFTTKDPNKGTGLGLSISKTAVERHNGDLFYDPSAVHTTFVIRIPLALKFVPQPELAA